MNSVAKIIDAKAKDKTLYTAWNCPLDSTDTPTMSNSQDNNAADLNSFLLGKGQDHYHPNFGLRLTISPNFQSGQHLYGIFSIICENLPKSRGKNAHLGPQGRNQQPKLKAIGFA
jgi:hypothetical protein